MTTFAEAAAARDAKWCVVATIEGVGTYSEGLWKFCSQVPDYGGAECRSWLTAWPELLTERADLLGGVPEAGAVDLEILDHGDGLTSQLALDCRAVTALAEDLDASETAVDVDAGSAVADDSIVFVGNEAMAVSSIASNTLTVTRGALGTDATTHSARDEVTAKLPYLRARKISLYLVPKDAASASEERLLVEAHVDRVRLSRDLCTWQIGGSSILRYLSRVVPRKPVQLVATAVGQPGGAFELIPAGTMAPAAPMTAWDATHTWAMVDDEIVLLEALYSSALTWWGRMLLRGQAGTRPGPDIQDGQVVTQVLIPDPTTGYGSFRWSPGPSPSSSRSSGTWTASDHWVDVALSLLLSSYSSDDGLELANRDDTYGAFDALPVGFGAGIPHDLIDWASWMDAKARTPAWRFPFATFGLEAKPIGEVLTEAFLRPLGAHLTITGGKIGLVVPRAPLEGDTLPDIDSLTILRDDTGGADGAPPTGAARVELSHDLERQVAAVIYRLRSSGGAEIQITATAADYAGTVGQRGYYAHDSQAIEIELPGARADAGGHSALVEDLAVRRLRRWHRPHWRLAVETDISLIESEPGESVAVTHTDLPNITTGTRGWTSVPCSILERAVRVDEDAGASLRFDLLAWPSGDKYGRIAPSGGTIWVAGPVGGNYTITLLPNVFTYADAPSTLPNTDPGAFVAGDVLELWNLDGTKADAGTQTVVSTSGDDVVVDGNWSGALADGLVVVAANRAQMSVAQAAQYAALADLATRTVGSSTDTPWQYVEP